MATRRAWLIVSADGSAVELPIVGCALFLSEKRANWFLSKWADQHPEWRAVQITWRWK